MPLEYNLAEAEQLGSIIVIIAYVIIIISAQKTKQEMLQPQEGTVSNSNAPTPPQLVAAAGWIRIIGVWILALVASARLKERENNISAGRETGSIEPNVKINSGAWIAVLAFFIEAVGAQQRAEEPGARVTFI